MNIKRLHCLHSHILTLMNHYSLTVPPLACICRICLVSAAVPLQVPNPRLLVCLQLRSPVWSQQHSSSRHTCSALAWCSHTSRPKVRSPQTENTEFSHAPTCAQWSCAYTALTIVPLVNLLKWVIHLNFCWILQKLCEQVEHMGWYVKAGWNDCKWNEIITSRHLMGQDGTWLKYSSHLLSLLFL